MTITITPPPAVTVDPVDARIAAGVDALDLFDPSWADRINLDTLDIDSSYQCVLGQMFVSYTRGADMLATRDGNDHPCQWGIDHGFDANSAEARADLTDRWVAVITDRRAAAA